MYNKNQKTKIMCPRCGRATKVQAIRGETKLHRFPLWCEKCKTEFIVDYDDTMSQSQRARAD